MNLQDIQNQHLYEMITDKETGAIKFPKDTKVMEMTAVELFGLLGAAKNIYFPEFWLHISQNFLEVKAESEISEASLNTDAITRIAIFANLGSILQKRGFKMQHECHFDDDIVRKPVYEKLKIVSKTYRFVKNGTQFWTGPFKMVVKIENDVIQFLSHEDNHKELEKITKYLEDYGLKHSVLRNKIIKMDGRIVKIERKFSWSDAILPEATKRTITDNVTDFYKNLAIYKKNKIALKRGIILHGPPGTGKTLIGKILACQTKSTFIWVTCQDILNGSVSKLFELARKLSPCIIFMEDMDFYSSKRSENYAKQTLGQLLAELDGFEANHGIVVIGTTNDIEAIDSAISERPSRFDIQIEVGRPNTAGRKLMLQNKFKGVRTHDIDWDKVAKETEEYSGSHLEELRTLTILTAVKEKSLGKDLIAEVHQEHIKKALEAIKIKRDTSSDAVGFEFDGDSMPESVEDVLK